MARRQRRKQTPPARSADAPRAARDRTGPARPTILVCGLLAGLVAVAFLPALEHGFLHFDDDLYVWNEPHVKSGFTVADWIWVWTQSHAANWHPLTTLSHTLDCEIFGLRAWGHHLVNLVLHALAAMLAFLVTERMTGRFWACAVLAAVFAVHPLRVESVLWVTERKDLLCGVFSWLTMAAYVRYARLPFSLFRYGIVIVCFALALLAKPMAVTLPFVLFVLDFWPLRRTNMEARSVSEDAGISGRRWPLLLLEKLPLLAMSLGLCLKTLSVQRAAVQLNEAVPFAARAANALMSYQEYLLRTFRPVGLAGHYPFPRQLASLPAIGGAAALLLGITTVAILLRHRKPYLLAGWLWYLGTLVPVIGLVQVGRQAMADRYTYLPQVGLLIMVVFAAADYLRSRPWLRAPSSLVAAILIAVLAVASWRQTRFWQDDFAFMERALACHEDDAEMHSNMAAFLIERRDFASAQPHAERAIELDPKSSTARANLAKILKQLGKLDAALEQAKRCVELSPREAEFRFLYGNLLALAGRYDEAAAELQEAVRLRPDFGPYRKQLQLVLGLLKKIESRRAVESDFRESP